MPYPNFHSCRLRDPDDFQADSFRPKESGDLTIILAKLPGEDVMTKQAFRYPVGDWTEARARTHCGEQKGTFEPAEKTEEQEPVPGGPETCVCPDCGHEAGKERGVPCRSMTCPECGASLVAKVEEAGRRVRGSKADELESIIDNLSLELDHLRSLVKWARYADEEEPPEGAVEETEGGTMSEIEEQTSDVQKMLGDALSALEKEDVAGAMKLVKSALAKLAPAEEPETEEADEQADEASASEAPEESTDSEQVDGDESDEEIDEAGPTKTVDGKQYPPGDFLVVDDPEKPGTWHLQVKKNGKPDHLLMGGAKAALTSPGGHRGNKYEGPNKGKAVSALKALYKAEDMEWMGEAGAQEAEPARQRANLCESYAGAVTFEEASAAAQGGEPLVMHVQLIRPGWGNKEDNNFYPAEMLRRDAGVFVGAKMFETDHRPEETSNRTWVSTVTSIEGFTDEGAPIAEVVAHDPNFIQRARNLQAAGLLDKLECSIKASGKTVPYEENGRKGSAVEAILADEPKSVDWVSRAGAGGHARNLQEGDPIGGGGKLSDEQVAAVLKESWLSDDAKGIFVRQAWADAGTLKEAVSALERTVKEASGSGKPFGLGESAPAQETLEEAEARKRTRFNRIMAEAGCRQV